MPGHSSVPLFRKGADYRRRLFVLAALLALILPVPAVAGPQGSDLEGRLRTYLTQDADILADVARNNNIGYLALLAANPKTDPWLPGANKRLILPTAHLLPPAERDGIVVNLGELRLFHFRHGSLVLSTPIGVGREGFDTPLGETKIIRKTANPTWYPTESVFAENPDFPRSVPPGPDNPLGSYALYLGWPGYLLHGTNKPDGVGRRVSRGCIRLYPEAVEMLYQIVPLNTRVTVLRAPVKLGWHEGELFLEAHPDADQLDLLEITYRVPQRASDEYGAWIHAEAGDRAGDLDWALINRTLMERSGLPVQVSNPATHPVVIYDARNGL